MKRRRRFVLPTPSRSHPGWTIGSAVLHGAAVVLLLVYSGPSFERVVTFIDIGGGGEIRQVELPPAGGVRPRGVPSVVRPGPGADPTSEPSREIEFIPPVETPSGVRPVRPDLPAPERGRPRGAERGEGDGRGRVARRGGRILGPRLGDGRVWVRPRDAIAAAIAEVLEGNPTDPALHGDRLDSAVAQRIYAFLDTLPRDSMALPRAPEWTTEIDGQTWGMDSGWIYLGGIKLPTAILALLPFPEGNYDQSRRAAALQRIREDILQAAWRAETAEQFKRYVEETRERREAERERERNRGIVPRDSIRT